MTAPAPFTTARIDSQIAAAHDRLQQARAFRTEMDQLRGHARSRDGAVDVAVDATGLVLRLDLRDPLPPARDLGRLVLETIRAAQQDVATKARTTAADRFGASSPTVARLDAELATRFAERDPDGTSIESARPDLGRASRWLQ